MKGKMLYFENTVFFFQIKVIEHFKGKVTVFLE